VVVGLLAGAGYYVRRTMTNPQLVSLNPTRARIGDRVTLTGKNFAMETSGNAVMVGNAAAPALLASETQVQLDVPEVAGPGFREVKVPVKVRVGDRETAAVELTVFEAPRIHGVSPDVAMPGEEVSLAGRGWGPGVVVRFGSANAEVLEVTPSALRVRVPSLEGAPGTPFQVVATMGQDPSNPAPFMVGRLPLIFHVEPQSAAPGDVVAVKGRGFVPETRDNLARVGGMHALLLSATESELKLVVPRVTAAGEQQVQMRVRGRDTVAEATLSVSGPAESVDFHFVAEPFDDVPGHDHAVLTTALGPAFLLAPSGGRSAGQRAVEAAQRLNEAAVALKASRDADLELRDPTGEPVIGLLGKPTPVLEISEADAAAFAEDWTRAGGKGGPVTRERLARWWLAVAKDLVLLLVRGEKPQFVAALAPAEGRVLGDVYQAARKTGQFGVPTSVAADAKPAMRESLRLLSVRVPATVAGTKEAAAPASASGPPLKLEGVFTGSEVDGGIRKYITLNVRGGINNTLAYEGNVQLSVPVQQVEQPQKGVVRFTVQLRGMRYYAGKWDGQKITGTISSDAAGKGDIGTFELMPGR
jgi:IPT/TIG domain